LHPWTDSPGGTAAGSADLDELVIRTFQAGGFAAAHFVPRLAEMSQWETVSFFQRQSEEGYMLTKALADFITGFTHKEIPKDVSAVAKQAILDYLGVTIAGSRENTSKIITAFVKNEGGVPYSGVIASGFKTSPFMAALANGTMGHALDYDDECESWYSHPTVGMLPAILALGEKQESSGRDVLAAYIMGWEVAAGIGRNNYFKINERGWHPTSAVGVISAAAASAKILGLKADKVTMALGIAASQTSGLVGNFGTDTKPFHAGLAASNGLRAAQLAQAGFTAAKDILESPLGYFKGVAGDASTVDLSKMASPFDIVGSLCIKNYPSCYGNHRLLDSMFYLIKKHKIKADDVAEVLVQAHPLHIKVLPYEEPKSGLEGKFSMQYSLASALLYGKAGLNEYADKKVLDPKAREFTRRVKVTAIPGTTIDDYTHCHPGQLVTVRMKNGIEYSHDVGRPKGHASNPVTQDEIAAKFLDISIPHLSKKDAEACVDLVNNLEELRNISDLMAIVCKRKHE
jgi:2-methylcitrate dehydratase PrpD